MKLSQSKVKEKHWYRIYSPPTLGNKEVGKALATSLESLLGRTVEVTLYELTGDVEQAHVHMTLQVKSVKNDAGFTEFKGHHFSRDYLGGRIRRRYSKVEAIFNVTTKDGAKLQLQAHAITANPASRSQRHAVRMTMMEAAQEAASSLSFYDFVQEMVVGKLAQAMQERAKKAFPLAFLDVVKSKVLSMPSSESSSSRESVSQVLEKKVSVEQQVAG